MAAPNIHINEYLDTVLKSAWESNINNQSRWAIFSDLHMGDGSTKDDFKPNSELFQTTLRDYYLKHNYSLILNGDVEELQRFSLDVILKNWRPDIRFLMTLQTKTDWPKPTETMIFS
jgi:hypothetical protein